MTEDERLVLLAAALERIERAKERLAISAEALARSTSRMADAPRPADDGQPD